MPASKWVVAMLLCPALLISSHAQQEESNLAVNPGFEEPAGGVGQPPTGWMLFTSKMNMMGVSDKAARSGSQSLKMSAQNLPDAFQGANFFTDVNEGERYNFSAFLVSDREDKIGGTAHVMLVIEWKRADGTEVTRTLSSLSHAQNISRLRWEQIQLAKVQVPKGAVKAAFGIHLCEGKKGGKGTVFVDDVLIERN